MSNVQMKKNEKGFTLVELLATVVLLAIILTLGTYSITTIIKNTKEKNYNLLVKNIESAVLLYYEECKYAASDDIVCSEDNTVSLGDLVKYGYLKGNGKKNDQYSIVNPKDNTDISSCRIGFSMSGSDLSLTELSSEDFCKILSKSLPSRSGLIINPSGKSGIIINPSRSSRLELSSGIIEREDDIVSPVEPNPEIDDHPIITPVIPRQETS